MKTWYCGKMVDMKVGQKVLIYKIGSGLSYFGVCNTENNNKDAYGFCYRIWSSSKNKDR